MVDKDGVIELEEGDQLELPPRPEVVIKTEAKYEREYTSLEELGKGKFGVVKKCRKKDGDLLLAAKFIKKTASSKKEVVREIAMMNLLHHKRLISLFDAYETPKEMIVIMELVTGGELFEKVVEEDNLTEKQVIRYTKQILYGVQHMHRKSMVHLDLKPENILCLGGEKPGYEEIKLIDFGMTRVLKEGGEEGAICGTPEFVAPEVINYDPVTIAADMWSMGVIVYVLLSGLSPFMGENDQETLRFVSTGEYDFDDDDGTFESLSDNSKKFIEDLLKVKPSERLTVDAALGHPWLKTVGNEKKLDVKNLKKFISRRRWQKTTNTIKAVSRLAGGLNLFSNKQRAHGNPPGTFLERVKKQQEKEEEDEKKKAEKEKKKEEEKMKKVEEEKKKKEEIEKKKAAEDNKKKEEEKKKAAEEKKRKEEEQKKKEEIEKKKAAEERKRKEEERKKAEEEKKRKEEEKKRKEEEKKKAEDLAKKVSEVKVKDKESAPNGEIKPKPDAATENANSPKTRKHFGSSARKPGGQSGLKDRAAMFNR